MKKLKTIIPYVGIILIGYLIIAFILWEFNPGNWSEEARVVTAIIQVFALLILF